MIEYSISLYSKFMIKTVELCYTNTTDTKFAILVLTEFVTNLRFLHVYVMIFVGFNVQC